MSRDELDAVNIGMVETVPLSRKLVLVASRRTRASRDARQLPSSFVN